MSLELLKAVGDGHIKQAEALLHMGISVDEQDENGRTALMIAVMNNDLHMAELLLDKGADLNIRDYTMLSPWLCAGANGFHKILQAALKYQPEITSINRFGGTVLLPSSEKGYLKTVEIALKAGVPVNHVNNLGWSALQEAVILGNGGFLYCDIIRKLLENGADPGLKDNEGKTAKDWAESRGEAQVTALLAGEEKVNYKEIRELIEHEKYEEAILKLGGGDTPEQCYLLGYCYTLLERYEEALSIYQKYGEEYPEFLFYRANVFRTMKRVKEALEEYDKAIQINPDYFFYRYHKSNYLRELGMHEAAVEEMDRLLSKEPARYDYLFHKANSLRTLGRHREAVEAMDQAIEADPKNPLYVLHKAQSLVLLKEYKTALELLEKAAKENASPMYLNELEAVRKMMNK